MTPGPNVYATHGATKALETAAAWLLGFLWVLPLLYDRSPGSFPEPGVYVVHGNEFTNRNLLKLLDVFVPKRLLGTDSAGNEYTRELLGLVCSYR